MSSPITSSITSSTTKPKVFNSDIFQKFEMHLQELEVFVLNGDLDYVQYFCNSVYDQDLFNMSFHHLCRLKPKSEDLTEKLLKSLQKFIIAKFDVNFLNNDMETALHIASRSGNLAVVKFLLEHGANRALTNKLEKTALQIAEDGKFNEIVKLLKKEDLIFIKNVNVLKFLELAFFSLHEVDKAIMAKASFLTGSSGIGKTTFINWKEGCPYKTDNFGGLIPLGKETIPTNSKSSSDTLTIKTYGNLLDSPGYKDTRGYEYDLSASISFCKLFESGQVQNIIFAIPASYFTSDKRYESLKDVCKRFGDMVADYEKIVPSVYFVITQKDLAPSYFPKKVEEFIQLKDHIISLLQEQAKKDHSPQLKHTIACLHMITEGNVLIADYSEQSKDLRAEFLERLKQMPLIPAEALWSSLRGERLSKIQSIVNEFFQKIVTAKRNDGHVNELLEVLQQTIAVAKDDLQKHIEEKRKQETAIFNPPIEGPKNRDDFRNYYKAEISRLTSQKELAEHIIKIRAKCIEGVRTEPQGKHNKSLNDLEAEVKKLTEELQSYDSDNMVVFYEKHWTEKLKWPRTWVGWSDYDFEYADQEKPYVTSEYTCAKGGRFKNLLDKPEQGHFSANYDSWWGQNGDATVKLEGKKKIWKKDEITLLKEEIKNLQELIKDKYNLIEHHRMAIDERSKEIIDIELRIKELTNNIEDLNKKDLQDQAQFNAEVQKQKEAFEANKTKKIREIQTKIEKLETKILDFESRKRTLESSIKAAAEHLAYVENIYDSERISLMRLIVKISKVKSVAFEEHEKIIAPYRKLEKESIPEKYCDVLHFNPLKRPVRHEKKNCQDGRFEESDVADLVARRVLCPSCQQQLLKEDLVRDEKLEQEIEKWLKEQTEKYA